MKTKKQSSREKRQRRRERKKQEKNFKTFRDRLMIFWRKYKFYCCAIIYLGFILISGLRHNILKSKLRTVGIKTEAVVLNLEYNKYKKRNNGYYYKFYVNDKQYRGHTITQYGIDVGDTIAIYYLKDDPEKNRDYTRIE